MESRGARRGDGEPVVKRAVKTGVPAPVKPGAVRAPAKAPMAPEVTREWTADAGWLAIIVIIALAIRIQGPWTLVFTPTHVNLLETDAWYHFRTIENLVRQFPHRLRFDPYASPPGEFVQVAPLFDLVIAGAAWISGFGHPSAEWVALVAVFTPPILGAITIVFVYAIARLSAGSLAGLLAAAMAAILPGHFLDRTLLGYVDHHAMEACLSSAVLYVTARAVVGGRAVVRTGVWLGVALAAYRLAWTSAAFLAAILAVWLLLHVALQSWRRSGIGDVPRIVLIASSVVLMVVIAARGMEPFRVNLMIAGVSILATIAAAAELGRRGIRAGWWSSQLLIGMTLAGAAAAPVLAALAFPDTFNNILGEMARFAFSTSADPGQVLEARPLFLFDGLWSLRPAWLFFRSGFIVGLIAIAALAVRWVRKGEPLDLLLIVWTTAMYAATIGQNRFGYYLVPATAIVGGCIAARLILAGQRAGEWQRSAAVIAVAGLIFGPNLVPAIWTTGRQAGLPTEWFPAFAWLRDHSAEPFGDPEYYYARYVAPGKPMMSSVMVWWDYGYWMMAAAHRVPTAIPTQGGAGDAGRFFTETDDSRARAILDGQRTRYVFVDELLPFRMESATTVMGKFETLCVWGGRDTKKFYDTFLFPETGGYRAAFLYFPDYYRTLTFRLGVTSGNGLAEPESASVVSWTLQSFPGTGPGTGTFRVVSELRDFSTYRDAVAFLAQLGPGNHAIVGKEPGRSPVPLDPIHGLQRVYRTPAPGAFQQGAVQVFEISP
jgi:oligosaccharyl transferase (archaeosortase A-associated)